MPTITIYRSVRTLGREFPGDWWQMSWDEHDWQPRPAVAWGGGGYAHTRSEPEPIAVRVPPGAVLAEVPTKDGRRIAVLSRRSGDPGLDAASVAWLARRGEGGFRVEVKRGEAAA